MLWGVLLANGIVVVIKVAHPNRKPDRDRDRDRERNRNHDRDRDPNPIL